MFRDILILIKQSIACGAGQVLIKAIGIILIFIYTSVLIVSDYGVINIAPLSAMLMYFYNLELSGAIMRYDAELSNTEERRIAHGTAGCFSSS